MTIPCMGGFCSSRNHCRNYFAKPNKLKPVERLCGAVEIIDSSLRVEPFYRNAAKKSLASRQNS